MRLPFAPPLVPMLSSAADVLPGGEGWQFEPKWGDEFREVSVHGLLVAALQEDLVTVAKQKARARPSRR